MKSPRLVGLCARLLAFPRSVLGSPHRRSSSRTLRARNDSGDPRSASTTDSWSGQTIAEWVRLWVEEFSQNPLKGSFPRSKFPDRILGNGHFRDRA